MGIFNLFKTKRSSNTVILKTADMKAYEKKIEISKRSCPVCGQDPYDTLLSFGTTDGVYNYCTCKRCDTDYKYKK